MTSRERALRIALQALELPVADRVMVAGALFGFGPFEEALEEFPDVVPCRSLIEVVEDIELGTSLSAEELTLLARLAELIPPRATRDFLAQRDGLIRFIVDAFCPSEAKSVSSRAAWLRERYERFTAGAELKRSRRMSVCPYSKRDLRAVLWQLAQCGPLPNGRQLRGILSEPQPGQ